MTGLAWFANSARQETARERDRDEQNATLAQQEKERAGEETTRALLTQSASARSWNLVCPERRRRYSDAART